MDASEGESDSANESQESTIIKLKLAEVNCCGNFPATAAELLAKESLRRMCYIN